MVGGCWRLFAVGGGFALPPFLFTHFEKINSFFTTRKEARAS
jgi:hypothetical protein